MPAITTGNTMAPCVVIGERAADLLLLAHGGHGTRGSHGDSDGHSGKRPDLVAAIECRRDLFSQ